MLSGPRQNFAEGYASGLNSTDAYAAAYPQASRDAARKHAPRLLADDGIRAEIERIRREAEKLAGIVEATGGMFQGVEVRVSDIVKAIQVDNDMSGDGAEAEANKAIAVTVRRAWKDD